MRNVCKVFTFMIALLMATIGCSLSGAGGNSPQEDLPDNILFKDGFSDPSSGWDIVNEPQGITDYVDGTYHIRVNESSYDLWSNPGLNFTDTVIQVEATKVDGSDDNDFGIICRYQDINNYYFFIISSDGYYGIARVVEGEQVLIGKDNLEYSDAIKQGDATNKIRVDCVGDRLTLYTNGEKLEEVNDSTYASGDVGLIAGTFDTPGTEIIYDNFLVREP